MRHVRVRVPAQLIRHFDVTHYYSDRKNLTWCSQTATRIQRAVPHMDSISSMKCVFIVARDQCQGNIRNATLCPTYMMVAFIPRKHNQPHTNITFTAFSKAGDVGIRCDSHMCEL